MKQVFAIFGALSLAAVAAPAAASQSLEGRWANAKRSVIVNVTRCGDAYCAAVAWATPKNRAKGASPGTPVLSDMRPQGGGVYKGRAFEPKRKISGSATVHQLGPNTMVIKGCAVVGLVCREQRWSRVTS